MIASRSGSNTPSIAWFLAHVFDKLRPWFLLPVVPHKAVAEVSRTGNL